LRIKGADILKLVSPGRCAKPFRVTDLQSKRGKGWVMGRTEHNVTDLLTAWSGGDEAALEKLVLWSIRNWHRTAHRYMARERSSHILQTTALINEVYMRLLTFRL